MTAPDTTGRFLILLGNGVTPTETFAWPCGANARSAKLTNSFGEQTLLDCTDPLASGVFVERYLTGQDTSVQISGMVAINAWPIWRAWADTGARKNIRLMLDETAARGGGYHALPARLTDFSFNQEGNGSSKMMFDASIVGDGARLWTPAT